MEQNGQVRKEPTMADLDAFEKLLRESLQAEPGKAQPAEASPSVGSASQPTPEDPSGASRSDLAAMAELARLVDAPLEFAPQPAAAPARDPAPPHAGGHVHGTAAASLAPAWAPEATVEAHFAQGGPSVTAQPVVEDPLAAFEEELRRFDAARSAESAAPDLRGAYSLEIRDAAAPPDPYAAPDTYQTQDYRPASAAPEPVVYADGFGIQLPQGAQRLEPQFGYEPEPRDPSPLAQAEDRIAAEAAVAAAGARSAEGRSRGVFLTLAGLAVAGIAVIGSSFLFSSGKKGGSGDVPVIAAKPQPTKEKPADAGGIEIPNQNKQVLASRNTPEAKPGQVVNNTEQPLDLNQVTKRDSVRVIAPSPYQSAPGAGSATGASEPTGSAQGPGGLVEPRRVTSIRLGEPTPPPAASTTGTSVAIPVLPPSPAAPAAPRVSAPGSALPPASAPASPVRTETPVVPAPKVETRPTTPQPRAETPQARAETPKTPPPPKVTPPKVAAANAPLSLSGAPTAAPAAGAAGGYAIQLASRPTEADARSASVQLKSKFAGPLGARALSVVSGEANGQTVYRVRAGGYSQAAAVDACTKIKAAGGGCFVTKQ